MTANVGSVASTSWRIFSERDLADSRFREAIVVIVRVCVKKDFVIFLRGSMREVE